MNAYFSFIANDSTVPLCVYVCVCRVQVEEWYAKREAQGLGDKERGKKRAVYLATDDSHLVLEALKKCVSSCLFLVHFQYSHIRNLPYHFLYYIPSIGTQGMSLSLITVCPRWRRASGDATVRKGCLV